MGRPGRAVSASRTTMQMGAMLVRISATNRGAIGMSAIMACLGSLEPWFACCRSGCSRPFSWVDTTSRHLCGVMVGELALLAAHHGRCADPRRSWSPGAPLRTRLVALVVVCCEAPRPAIDSLDGGWMPHLVAGRTRVTAEWGSPRVARQCLRPHKADNVLQQELDPPFAMCSGDPHIDRARERRARDVRSAPEECEWRQPRASGARAGSVRHASGRRAARERPTCSTQAERGLRRIGTGTSPWPPM